MASKVSELSIFELAGVTLTEGSGPLGKVRKPGVSAVMTSAELKVSVQDFSHSTVKFSKSNKTSESCQNTKRTSLKNLSPEVTSDLSEEKDWHCCAKSSHNSATMEQLHHNQKESWLYDKGLQFFQPASPSLCRNLGLVTHLNLYLAALKTGLLSHITPGESRGTQIMAHLQPTLI